MNISKTSSRVYDRNPVQITTLTTVPAGVSSGAVTVTSSGTQFSVSSAELSVKAGDWIFDPTQLAGVGQVRKVIQVTSSTTGILNEAFTVDLTADAVTIIDGDDVSKIWAIDFIAVGTTTLIDGQSFLIRETYRISIPSLAENTVQSQIKPVIVDGTSSKTCNVITHFIK